jgi:hypothetical protein
MGDHQPRGCRDLICASRMDLPSLLRAVQPKRVPLRAVVTGEQRA